jgi:hypothetical protein
MIAEDDMIWAEFAENLNPPNGGVGGFFFNLLLVTPAVIQTLKTTCLESYTAKCPNVRWARRSHG